MHRYKLSCLLLHLSFFSSPFQEWSRVSYKRAKPSVYLFNEIPTVELGFQKLSRSSEILFCDFFFHVRLLLMVFAFNILKYLKVSFCSSVLILSWFGNSVPSVIYIFPLLFMSMAYFLCQIPFLYPNCIFLLLVLVSSYFSFHANSLMSFIYIRW